MKKKNLLLSLFSCALLLGGCSDTGDENPVVTDLASELEKFAGYTELRCDTSNQEWYEDDEINVADMLTLPGKLTYDYESKIKVKGLDSLMLNSEEINHMRFDFTISECLPVLKKTKEQAKAMFDSYSSYFVEYNWDEANDHAYVVIDNKREDEPDLVLVHMPNPLDQGYNVYFKDNKMTDFRYLLNDQSMEEYTSSNYRDSLVKMYKEHIKDVVVQDGQYVLDLKDNSLSFGLMEATKMALKIEENQFTFTCDGLFNDYGDRFLDVHSVMRFYAFGNAEFVVPSYELHCPFEHACQKYEYYNEQGHVLACTYCHKYLSNEVHAHNHDDKHDICYDCFNYINDMYTYEGDELKVNGELVISYSANKVGTLYARSMLIDFDVSNSLDVNYSDGVYYTQLSYSTAKNVLILEKCFVEEVVEGTCIEEYKYVDYIFKDVNVTLTPEQQQEIEEHEWAKSSVYCQAIGINDGYESLVTKYGEPIATKDRYHIYSWHKETKHEDHEIGCITWRYWICEECGMDTSATKIENHDWKVVEIVHPTWGDEEKFVYVKLVCNHCGSAPEYAIYAYQKGVSTHDMYANATAYTENGSYRGWYEYNVPHCDLDHDDHCDICGLELAA